MRPSLEETRKTVTVVFCDVVGSTSLGDRLDPEALRQVMTRFYVAMREALERHGGSVQKYIGDAVMAVFGIPRLHEDDALRAVRAAQEMREALERLNEELAAGWDVRLQTRIGINTGEVVVGDAAAGEALVLGDAVNVAARLEQAAGVGSVLMGAETYALVRDHVEAEPVEPMELKGKPGLVHAYRLVAARPVEAPAMRPEPPLVGRSEELAVLRAGFDRAVAKGSAVLATVLGPAGIGKSRLAREVVAGLDALVVTGRCLPYGDGITFWPIAEIVKQASAVADDDPAEVARAKIEAAITGAEDAATVQERLAGLLGISDAPAAELQETFWAVRRFLERLGERRPVVVVLDDLQWAEPTLLDLVEYLAGWTRQTALFLLCLARPDLLELRPSWGTVGWPSSSVTLDPLDEQESRRLVSGLLEGLPLDDAAMDRIAAAAGGNALFLEEMLRMLED
ncbi:MAG TPA: adenylate/guanylate cyclase domain-containing protein, partial [Actinomycetota bacterium]|nr:adenylate/guanylate cyclase domain-containing protein [Actinomycetota bacterium]